MKKEKDSLLTDFENKLNYKFKKKTILKEALTHSSFHNKNLNDKITSNERLEFLGDSVLELIVSEYLYLKLLSFSEGKLTKIKSIIVSKPTLTKWANSISLGKYIILGKGEDLTGGRNKSSILSSCFEALLGAIYLDSGFKKVKKYILSFLNEEIKTIESGNYIEDYKTLLQEISQKKMKCLPEYYLLKEKGPDHKKKFCIEVRLKEIAYGIGLGDNKKEAEQQAAQNALKKLKIMN